MLETILYIVILPGILANVLHMFLVKKNVAKTLATPIHKGVFGANKTYRGFVVVTVFTGLFSGLGSLLLSELSLIDGLITGSVLGFVYTLFELPNSFLKRRLGIEAGGRANRNKIWFAILDKTDSTFGVSFAYYWMADLSWKMGVLLFLGSVVLHVTFSFLLVAIKVKKSF